LQKGSALKLRCSIISAIGTFAKDFSDAELNMGFHTSTTAAVIRTRCATFRAALLTLLSHRKLRSMISGLFPSIVRYSLPSSIILSWRY